MNQDPGLASWLQLALTPGLGSVTFRTLLRQFGLPQAILARRRAELAPHAAPAVLTALDSEQVSQAVSRARAWADQPGHFVITLADESYPRLLLD